MCSSGASCGEVKPVSIEHTRSKERDDLHGTMQEAEVDKENPQNELTLAYGLVCRLFGRYRSRSRTLFLSLLSLSLPFITHPLYRLPQKENRK